MESKDQTAEGTEDNFCRNKLDFSVWLDTLDKNNKWNRAQIVEEEGQNEFVVSYEYTDGLPKRYYAP